MDGGFADYLEELIAAIAARPSRLSIEPVDIAQLHRELFADRPEAWTMAAGQALERLGLGNRARPVGGAAAFLINAAGLRHAREKIGAQSAGTTGSPEPEEVMGMRWFPLLYQPHHSSLRSSNDP